MRVYGFDQEYRQSSSGNTSVWRQLCIVWLTLMIRNKGWYGFIDNDHTRKFGLFLDTGRVNKRFTIPCAGACCLLPRLSMSAPLLSTLVLTHGNNATNFLLSNSMRRTTTEKLFANLGWTWRPICLKLWLKPTKLTWRTVSITIAPLEYLVSFDMSSGQYQAEQISGDFRSRNCQEFWVNDIALGTSL